MIEKLGKSCHRLDAPAVARQIFQGLITSADPIYHLKRLGKNRYQHQPPKPEGSKTKPPAEEVEIEDAIMHPLVSGQEANRYEVPDTSTFILFPYRVEAGEVSLLSRKEIVQDYPKAWNYLKRFEKKLRARESNGFDDQTWWRFGRHQNIDKQEERKLIVAQTVRHLSVCPDDKGKFYLNNVRVNGILLNNSKDFWYLLGILNSEPADWVFRRIAKPKEGGYFEANKQFIAPLPIPKAKPTDADKVAQLAQKLTRLHTERRDTEASLARRFEACEVEQKPVEWLWPSQVRGIDAWKAKAPGDLSTRQKANWAKEQQAKQIEFATDALKDRLRPGAHLEVELVKGELRVHDDGTTVLDGVFVNAKEAKQVLIDWRNYLRVNPITETPERSQSGLKSPMRTHDG